jgi:hypothetical protein
MSPSFDATCLAVSVDGLINTVYVTKRANDPQSKGISMKCSRKYQWEVPLNLRLVKGKPLLCCERF